ncbi:LPS export ABC transporter permease LptG [Noviherbaspirillum sedimenti]|uniref:LPS export ABC transporter permease LptG n=1 Tax=Noviherbaspirillum sedimenti TaxID=2320865 RepID=A0A3A3GKK5_9BURK|nr:LPS export ABC transporter permease LptG [Noviherbaspirillum sedimenti]RJG01490.1 LPS export ABC transporter permease LptG [Noviherbaspirillum sedimenti]
MKTLQKYVLSEIFKSVLFVLVAFLALFAFFDMMGELSAVGHGSYTFQGALVYVLLGLPGYAYELMPIAALIGTIYTLSQLASRSEFTIMRVSGMSTWRAGMMLAKIGLVFAVLTILFGELIAPKSSEMAEKWKLRAQGANLSQEFRSGLWAKDTVKAEDGSGAVIGSRFINVRQVQPDGLLNDVRVYEFDHDFRLKAMLSAVSASYLGDQAWQLRQVVQTQFAADAFVQPGTNAGRPEGITMRQLDAYRMVSEITPDILSVVFADPDRMSAKDLAAYTRHLEENRQATSRYEIAFWKKVVYPFAVFVMLALALPFAYMHFRSGGVSLKIFSGIMIGVAFQLLNNLFSHLGLINTWPAFATAALPSTLFLLMAIGALWWVERH